MATYLILNIVFLAIVLVVAYVIAGRIVWNRYVALVLVVLMITTAIFDSLIIASGIVGYDSDKLLGITIGVAPIEDFFYAILAGVLVPTSWHYFRKDEHATN